MKCGAKLRCRDAYCNNPALANKRRCRLHGGVSLAGKDHPNFTHGLRSKEYIVRAKEAREKLGELLYLGRMLGMFVE